MMKTYINLFVGSLLLATSLMADTKKVAYPEGYRDWTHVKTMIIEPGHDLENPFGGIHHVYANAMAKEGLRTGNYIDGSTLVFDLLNYTQKDKAITESTRKLVGVMYKDKAKFAKTGGWGFEGLAGDTQDKRLVSDGGVSCFACHMPQEKSNFVFSQYRK